MYQSIEKLVFKTNIWDKVCKNGPSEICGRQSLKNFTWSILEYSGTSLKRTLTGQKFLSALERCPPWRGLN